LAAPLRVAISKFRESVFLGFWAVRDTEFYLIPPCVPAADDTVKKATDKSGDAADYLNINSPGVVVLVGPLTLDGILECPSSIPESE
jgi:hypothetical protein